MMRPTSSTATIVLLLQTLATVALLLLPFHASAFAADMDTEQSTEIRVELGGSVREKLTLVNTFDFRVSGQLEIIGKDCEEVPTLRLLDDEPVDLGPGEEVKVRVEAVAHWRDDTGWTDFPIICELDESVNTTGNPDVKDVTLLTVDVFVARSPWPFIMLIIICISILWLFVRWRRKRRTLEEEILERNMD